MTDTELRELDVQIAAKLFGWRWYAFDGGHYSESMDGGKRGTYQRARVRDFMRPWQTGKHAERWRELNITECTEADMALPVAYDYHRTGPPTYAGSWEGMRLVVEEMQRRGYWCRMQTPFDVNNVGCEKWTAGFCPMGTSWNGAMDFYADANTLPEAVALAALRAIAMTEQQPTAADLTLAEEIFRELHYSTAFGQEREVAALIARRRSESEENLRAEIERLRAANAELLAACKAMDGSVIKIEPLLMAEAELYPRLTALGVRIVRDDPNSLPGVEWNELEAAMRKLSPNLLSRWARWSEGNTCGMNGTYADDVERFLGGLPNDD